MQYSISDGDSFDNVIRRLCRSLETCKCPEIGAISLLIDFSGAESS
jgi:hypothetical protein